MRTISYNSIRLTLLDFKQRRVALVHGTKMLVLLFLTGFSWQPAVADAKASTRVGSSPAHISGKNGPAAVTANYWTTVQLITNSGSTTEVQGTDQIRYTVHVQNTGTDPIIGLKIVDSIPANTAYLSASAGASYSAADQIVHYDLATTVAPGASVTYSFSVLVNDPIPASLSYIRHTSYVDLGDGTLLPASATSGGTPPVYPAYAINTPVDNGSKAVAWKTQEYWPQGDNGNVKAGDNIRYIIWVRNTGTVPLTNVVVSDFVPSYTGFIMALGGGTKDVNDRVSWTIPSLPVGAQDSMSFFVRVATDLTGAKSIDNTAQVDLNNGKPAINTVPGDATGLEPSTIPTSGPSTTIAIKSVTSFEAWKIAVNENNETISSIGPSEDITYIIYVRNTGNVSIASLTINDNIPIGTTFKDVKDGGSFNEGNDNNSVSWIIDNIAAGAVTTVHFTVTVDKHVEGLKNISNTAVVDNGDTTLSTRHCDPSLSTCDGKVGTIVPLQGAKAGLFISNVVTPNNDGKNDAFIVRGITATKYRGSELHVYNRWGNEVYQSKDYNNNWMANGLSEGTYYYILDLNDEGVKTKYQGWVMIIR